MGYDRAASKQVVSVSLNEDLVRQTEALTGNLSATVEDLLASFIDQQQARRQHSEAATDALIAAFNKINERDGLLSDEFQSF